MNLVVGLDSSTTATKAVAWTREGPAVAEGLRGVSAARFRGGGGGGQGASHRATCSPGQSASYRSNTSSGLPPCAGASAK
jgi:hypothetical protein